MQQLNLPMKFRPLPMNTKVRILSKHNGAWDQIPWRKGDIGFVSAYETIWGSGDEKFYFLSCDSGSYYSAPGHFTREDLEVIEYATQI